MCYHVRSFVFGISGSWPAAAAAHWFPCVSTCSWLLRPQRCRRPLTPTRRFRSGLVHFAAALWLWWNVSLLFRSRSGLLLRFTPPNMRTATRHRSFNASKSGRYCCASNAVFLRSARFQQTYPDSLQRSLASIHWRPTRVNPPRQRPLALLCLLWRFHARQR